MLLTQLPSLLFTLLAAWLFTVNAQDTAQSETKSDVKSIPLRTHSLASPYLDTDLQSRWWDYGGDTIIRADKHIRLTSDRPSQSGWIFSRVPLTATNWQVEFEFAITGKGSLFGDGFAMWVTKNRAQQGDVFGMQDKFEGLGIFFDTYKNNRPGVVFPYVMAMLGDGQTAYDKANDGKANELAGCSARGLRNAGFPTKARITYFAEKSLQLQLMYKNEDDWTDCFEISDIKLPSVTYLGFSAETGELSDNHDIVKVETKNLYSPTGATTRNRDGANGSGKGRGSPKSKSKSKSKKRNGGGGWGWFFLKFVLFGLALVGGYIGYTVYRSNRRRDRF